MDLDLSMSIMQAARPAKINAALGIETSKSREAIPRRAFEG
jgi:hypothetical protein